MPTGRMATATIEEEVVTIAEEAVTIAEEAAVYGSFQVGGLGGEDIRPTTMQHLPLSLNAQLLNITTNRLRNSLCRRKKSRFTGITVKIPRGTTRMFSTARMAG